MKREKKKKQVPCTMDSFILNPNQKEDFITSYEWISLP